MTGSPTNETTARRIAAIRPLLIDTVAPLAIFYALRSIGTGQWLALVVSGAIPLVLLLHRLATRRRVDTRTLFTLSIMICGTVVGLLTGDPRLLVARESYLTGLLGLWMIGTLLASRPFVLTMTLPLLPEATADSWRRDWLTDATFRRVMRLMTLAWGGAFLIDAAARLVMAYTIPLDLVPLLSAVLLVVMLIGVVQGGKRYGRRRMAAHVHSAPAPETGGTGPATQSS